MAVRISIDNRAIERVAQQAAQEVARRAQPDFDRLYETHANRPVAEIQPRMKALFDKWGLEPSDTRTIRSYAEQLAAGTRIKLRT